MGATNIEWAERVWNPVTGCDKVSEGCKNCYAERQARWLQGMKSPKYANGFKPTFHPEALNEITPRQKPAVIFVPSMSDLFHPGFTWAERGRILIRMRECSQHRFMLLTKRETEMLEFFRYSHTGREFSVKPPPNIALGVSVESQPRAEERMLLLIQCRAAYYFISVEPMLGPVDIEYLGHPDLVICGGESGSGARMMHPEWVRSLRDQCATFEIPFCFKQWGGVNKKKTGRLLDGKLYDGKIDWRA